MDIKIYNFLLYIAKWLFIAVLISILVGSASALFLYTLDLAGKFRDGHPLIIILLPLAGLAIGYMYFKYGNDVIRGNNHLIDEFHTPKSVIPFKMAPMVYIGTLLTHLFGGSAGREGTAVQMGGAIADQFTPLFKLSNNERKTILIIGISAGFSSVFGTPLAAAVFALEVLSFRKLKSLNVCLALAAAFIADYICRLYPIQHSHYRLSSFPVFNFKVLFWCVIAGLIFGVAAYCFSSLLRFFESTFKKLIRHAVLRPAIGGAIIAVAVYFVGTRYIGLGVPIINNSFESPQNNYDFLLKILFTTFTLGAGFKGGEVTPLFFIGATLGNILSCLIPLPMALLAAMGFVSVFAGATNTPLASCFLGFELFGAPGVLFISISCVVAYVFAGKKSIYHSQLPLGPKYLIYKKLRNFKK